MKKKLFAGSIFTDYNQFYLLDGDIKPIDFQDKCKSNTRKHGYETIDGGIRIFTTGGFWVHWIEVFLNEMPPVIDDCERGFVLSINILTEKLSIATPTSYDDIYMNILPGNYAVYILAYNLGKESDEELSDEELEQRTDLERYKIVLVPGKTMNEGVIKGSKYLPDCIEEENQNV
jgi:hypothetical protein